MKDREPISKVLMALPLILGVSSFFPVTLFLNYYIADHVSYTVDILLAGPIFSFIGVILSVIMRRSRELYPTLWKTGLIVCLFGLMVCVLFISLFLFVIVSAFKGIRS